MTAVIRTALLNSLRSIHPTLILLLLLHSDLVLIKQLLLLNPGPVN
jgi:hypothetical protein